MSATTEKKAMNKRKKIPYELTEAQVDRLMQISIAAGSLWSEVCRDQGEKENDEYIKWLRSIPTGARNFILDSQ